MLSNKVFISVIIPTYNPNHYMLECLDSISNQTLSFDFFEVLVIFNGCSKDIFGKLGKELLIKYSNINIRLFHIEDAGVSKARNLGLDKAKGNAICFIDDDDIISPFYLEELINLYTNNTIVVSDVISFKKVINNSFKDYLGEAFHKLKYQDEFSLFFYRSFFSSACCKLIPMHLIKDSRFSEKYKVGEDSFFMTSISDGVENVDFTSDKAIYYRRLRENSASRRRRRLNVKLKERFKLIIGYLILYRFSINNNPNI